MKVFRHAANRHRRALLDTPVAVASHALRPARWVTGHPEVLIFPGIALFCALGGFSIPAMVFAVLGLGLTAGVALRDKRNVT